MLGWVLVCFCSKVVGKFVLVGMVAHFVLFFSHPSLFFLLGDLFVFRVLFAFGFGHRFSRWSFVSVWEYFLSGSCSEYVAHVLRWVFRGVAVLVADFSVFSLAYLCGSVWGNGARFGTSIFLFLIFITKGYFISCEYPSYWW